MINEKKKKYHTVETVQNPIGNRRKRQIDTINTQIHDLSLSWIGTGTSLKSGRVTLAL